LTAPWRSDTKKQFDGLVVEASVKVSEIELCFIAFSRCLEAQTSPLRIYLRPVRLRC
jgi:hypothetical protein